MSLWLFSNLGCCSFLAREHSLLYAREKGQLQIRSGAWGRDKKKPLAACAFPARNPPLDNTPSTPTPLPSLLGALRLLPPRVCRAEGQAPFPRWGGGAGAGAGKTDRVAPCSSTPAALARERVGITRRAGRKESGWRGRELQVRFRAGAPTVGMRRVDSPGHARGRPRSRRP